MSGNEHDPPRRFRHDRVFLRVPSGTDPLTAMREAMAVFMERDEPPVLDGVIDTTTTDEPT